MRPLLAITACAVALLLSSTARAAPIPSELDQSFTSSDNVAFIIGDCCDFVGQTFTAGRSGALTAVAVDVYHATPSEPEAPLRLEIRNVEGGLPGDEVLAEVVLASDNAPLSQLNALPEPVAVSAGVQYAIVASLVDPTLETRAGWIGGSGALYPGGGACLLFEGSWTCDEELDLHFQTYVARAPTSKDECKHGGWRDFPGFKNQGDCVSLVATP
jgi:hypothetical protein